ncbi:MAG: hypothetical protein ACK4ND_11870, partial [Cytophagaceae bacterium]
RSSLDRASRLLSREGLRFVLRGKKKNVLKKYLFRSSLDRASRLLSREGLSFVLRGKKKNVLKS